MIKIEELSKAHNRNDFDCGQDELNKYLQNTARQHIEKGLSRTYVLVDVPAPSTILGFYTISVCEVQSKCIPDSCCRKYPNIIPGAKLARLAVHKDYLRQGKGKKLMVHAMEKAILVADTTGIVGFFVDAKDDEATQYYKQYGFISFPDNRLTMFLPLDTLRTAFGVREHTRSRTVRMP